LGASALIDDSRGDEDAQRREQVQDQFDGDVRRLVAGGYLHVTEVVGVGRAGSIGTGIGWVIDTHVNLSSDDCSLRRLAA
jgi:hypothetical protein